MHRLGADEREGRGGTDAASRADHAEDIGVLVTLVGGSARTWADVGEPDRLRDLTDGALVVVDVEAFEDDLLQIDAAASRRRSEAE